MGEIYFIQKKEMKFKQTNIVLPHFIMFCEAMLENTAECRLPFCFCR